MRFWVTLLAGHLMLGISALWITQHVAKVYTHGWLVSMGLTGASTAMAAATFVGLALVYLIQVRLAMAVFGLWRDWLRGRTSS